MRRHHRQATATLATVATLALGSAVLLAARALPAPQPLGAQARAIAAADRGHAQHAAGVVSRTAHFASAR